MLFVPVNRLETTRCNLCFWINDLDLCRLRDTSGLDGIERLLRSSSLDRASIVLRLSGISDLSGWFWLSGWVFGGLRSMMVAPDMIEYYKSKVELQ